MRDPDDLDPPTDRIPKDATPSVASTLSVIRPGITRLVIVESPFAGDVERNLAYCRAAMADCLRRNEAPFASHALYTQPGVLDDQDEDQRARGILAGFSWRSCADATVVYCDRGISTGMAKGIDHARSIGSPLEYRWLGAPWSHPLGERF